jgi:predicted enzyme related to lactoylglutathione lyase
MNDGTYQFRGAASERHNGGKGILLASVRWQLTDFGPTYSCTVTGDVDLGLQGDTTEATSAPLAVIAVDDLENALASVEKAGGKIVKPIFSFPGGRRFHFRDPNGNELAILEAD